MEKQILPCPSAVRDDKCRTEICPRFTVRCFSAPPGSPCRATKYGQHCQGEHVHGAVATKAVISWLNSPFTQVARIYLLTFTCKSVRTYSKLIMLLDLNIKQMRSFNNKMTFSKNYLNLFYLQCKFFVLLSSMLIKCNNSNSIDLSNVH